MDGVLHTPITLEGHLIRFGDADDRQSTSMKKQIPPAEVTSIAPQTIEGDRVAVECAAVLKDWAKGQR